MPGPFTVELTQFSSMLISYYLIFFYSRVLAGLQQHRHTLLDQRASNRGPTYTKTEGRCFENYETHRDSRFVLFFLVRFWGSLASLATHEYTPLAACIQFCPGQSSNSSSSVQEHMPLKAQKSHPTEHRSWLRVGSVVVQKVVFWLHWAFK